ARMDFAAAQALLEPLVDHPTYAVRARFLLGEAAEKKGDLVTARRLYEQVCAWDLDYASARSRAERLGRMLVPASSPALPQAPALVPTMLAADSGGASTSRYRLLAELGRGGAATVYLARDQDLDRDVALKILHPQFYGEAHAAARAAFFAEARIAASLRHVGIVAIYDVDEPLKLIAMEYCSGRTLRDRLRRGRLAPAEALARGIELYRALASVHARGVVHRDLKPGNLLYRGDPDDPQSTLVIGDFGTANLAAAAGTLLYMAPEQRRGAPPSQKNDMFSAGAILFEMLAGTPPFAPEDLLRDPLPDVRLPALGLPRAAADALSALVRASLAADPATRPSDPEALAAAHAVKDQLALDDTTLAAWDRALDEDREA